MGKINQVGNYKIEPQKFRCTGRTTRMLLDVLAHLAADPENTAVIVSETHMLARNIQQDIERFLPKEDHSRLEHAYLGRLQSMYRGLNPLPGNKVFIDHFVMDRILERAMSVIYDNCDCAARSADEVRVY
jgi:hypothetical protein